MMQAKLTHVVWAVLISFLVVAPVDAQQKAKKKAAKGKASMVAPGGEIPPAASLDTPGLQEDFPAICIAPDGATLVAYLTYDGTADALQVAEVTAAGFGKPRAVSEPGNIFQPCLACDGDGAA